VRTDKAILTPSGRTRNHCHFPRQMKPVPAISNRHRGKHWALTGGNLSLPSRAAVLRNRSIAGVILIGADATFVTEGTVINSGVIILRPHRKGR